MSEKTAKKSERLATHHPHAVLALLAEVRPDLVLGEVEHLNGNTASININMNMQLTCNQHSNNINIDTQLTCNQHAVNMQLTCN